MTYGIEPVHSGEFQHESEKYRKSDIDEQQDLNHHLSPVTIIVPGQGGHLDTRKHHFAGTQCRQEHQREHHHAHTSDPGRGHPPELQSPGQRLDILQNRRSCGRKARNSFEPSIYHAELTAPDQVGKHTDDAGEQP